MLAPHFKYKYTPLPSLSEKPARSRSITAPEPRSSRITSAIMRRGQPYLGLRGPKLIWTMIFSVVLPFYFMAGYNNAVPGGLLTLDTFVATFPQIDTVHTTGAAQSQAATIQGTTVAIYLVGCMLGALSCIKLGDIWGRTKTVLIGGCFTVVGSTLHCSAFSLGQLMAARVILGLGVGALGATIPPWQAECSPAHHRGALVTLEGAFATIGLGASQFIDLGCYFDNTSFSWRFPLAVPLLCSFIVLASIRFLPESPRWLVKKGRIQEAQEIMAILDDLPPDSERVADEIRAMQRSLEAMGEGSFTGIFKDKNDNKTVLRTALAMFSTFSQQMNGAGLVGFYTTNVFLELGLDPIVARVLAACVYVWQLPCCYACYYLVDRVGRRFLLISGAIGMGLMFVVLSVCIHEGPTNKTAEVFAAIAMFGYAFFFGISYAVNWLFPTEVAPLAYRTQIYALTIATQFGTNFMVVEVTPLGITNLGYQFFIIWAVMCLCMILPVTYFFYPETTGHTLEDMDRFFKVAKGPLDVVKVSKRVRQDAMIHRAGDVEVTELPLEKTDIDVRDDKDVAVHYEEAP